VEDITLDGWIDRYVDFLRMRHYSDGTIENYRRSLRSLSAGLVARAGQGEAVKPADVTTAALYDHLAAVSEEGHISPRTLNWLVCSYSSFFRFLVTQGAVDMNPADRIERPKIGQTGVRCLKHGQVSRLLRSIDDSRDRLIVRLIYATGVRVSELCGMRVEEVDLDDGMIRVTGKGNKERVVFLDDATADALGEFIGDRTSGPLFTGYGGKPISTRTVQLLFKRCAPEGVTPHTIRHSYASELYRRSRNLRIVQENLGHTSIKTTEIYLHTDLEERREVYRRYFPLASGDDDRGD
jgi:site-specific recombinase XerC